MSLKINLVKYLINNFIIISIIITIVIAITVTISQ